METYEDQRERIAVVGAGIFGMVIALELDAAGYMVDLFDSSPVPLRGASAANQFRSHRGYHYPRSRETIESCMKWTPAFEHAYPEAIIQGRRMYCIAKEGSLTSPLEYIKTCEDYSLPYRRAEPDFVNSALVSLTIEVKENAIDIEALGQTLKRRLRASRISPYFGQTVTDELTSKYAFTVVACYSATNSFFIKHVELQRDYQFELCEKPVVRLSGEFKDTSIVVMDGPFFCVDPYGRTKFHVMGNVVEAVHAMNIGREPIVPEKYKKIINQGLIAKPPVTRFEDFILAAIPYVPLLEKAEHIGSFFTFRAVLPNKEATDERPTIVRLEKENIATVFSGKIGTCTAAAARVLELVREHTKL